VGAAVNGPLLVVHPGADWSTGDLYQGLVPSLRRLGVPVVEYPLSHTLQLSDAYLKFLHRKQKRHGGPLKDTPPTGGDVLYHASAQAIERALFFGCEWVLIMTGMYFSLRALKLLRRAGLKIAILLTESPYDSSSEFAFAAEADLCWTNERLALGALRLACPRTQYLPHAYDPAKHFPVEPGGGLPPAGATGDAGAGGRGRFRVGDTPLSLSAIGAAAEAGDGGGALESSVPAHDVVFVGSGFKERIELLSAVDWTGIDFGLYGAWRGLPSRHPLRKHLRDSEVDNVYAAALYRKAKVGLNLFRSSIGHADTARARIPPKSAESLSPRLLELAACGTFIVSEWRREVGEVFGGAVPTFRDAAGLQSLLAEWLPRDGDRAKRAQGLPARVADRTFDGMARTVVRDLVKADADGEAWKPLEERLGVVAAA
jgi:hypothetical protein